MNISSPPRAVTSAMFGWAFLYASYRGYYALGGRAGMIGRPVSAAEFRAVNAVGAVIVLVGAVLPLVLVRLRPLHRWLPVLGWVVAVGCCMHALVDSTLRVLSVTGLHLTELPTDFWAHVDRSAADWQDLLLNEPFFLVEGLLWGALAVGSVHVGWRRPWLISAGLACAVLTAVGVLSGLGVVPAFHVG